MGEEDSTVTIQKAMEEAIKAMEATGCKSGSPLATAKDNLIRAMLALDGIFASLRQIEEEVVDAADQIKQKESLTATLHQA